MSILVLVLPIFAVIVTGWAVGKSGLLSSVLADALIQFAYYIAMPALLFLTIAKEPAGRLLDIRFVLAFGGGSLLIFGLILAGARWLGNSGLAAATVRGLAAAMTNTGFVALPLLHSMFGSRALLPAAIATFFVAVVMFPLGVVLVEAASHAGRTWHGAAAETLASSLRNPMVNSTLAGLAWTLLGLPLPVMLADYLEILAGALTPCALFAIGLGLQVEGIRRHAVQASALSLVKLVAVPAVVLLIALAVELPPFGTVAAVVCAAVPTAKSVYIMAGEYDLERELVATTISLTTLGSVLTLLGWLMALSHLMPAAFAGA